MTLHYLTLQNVVPKNCAEHVFYHYLGVYINVVIDIYIHLLVIAMMNDPTKSTNNKQPEFFKHWVKNYLKNYTPRYFVQESRCYN